MKQQIPVVTMAWLRRKMRRAMVFGFCVGAGIVGFAWVLFYLITERYK